MTDKEKIDALAQKFRHALGPLIGTATITRETLDRVRETAQEVFDSIAGEDVFEIIPSYSTDENRLNMRVVPNTPEAEALLATAMKNMEDEEDGNDHVADPAVPGQP